MFFSMTLDRTQRVLSFLVVVSVLAALVAVSFVRMPHASGYLVAMLVAVSLVAAAARAPAGLELGPDEVRIRRRFSPPMRVSADEVTAIEPGPSGFGLRLCGAAGFFGCYGLFWVARFGCY